TAEIGHRLPHGGQVDDRRDTGEVLHHHPGRGELDLLARLGVRVPAGQCPDVVGGDVRAVLGAQQVLQQDLQAVRQLLRAVHGGELEDLVRAVADIEGGLGVEAVDAHEFSVGFFVVLTSRYHSGPTVTRAGEPTPPPRGSVRRPTGRGWNHVSIPRPRPGRRDRRRRLVGLLRRRRSHLADRTAARLPVPRLRRPAPARAGTGRAVVLGGDRVVRV